jgi:hypothetical protein
VIENNAELNGDELDNCAAGHRAAASSVLGEGAGDARGSSAHHSRIYIDSWGWGENNE